MEGWKNRNRDELRRRTQELRKRISQIDYLASGTLHIRTKTCGRANCRCSTDPAARHGPYYEWSRRQGGRLVHHSISADQAELLARALDNHGEVAKLLARWERETVQKILDPRSPDKT